MPDWLTGMGAGLSAAFAADSAGQEVSESPDWLEGEATSSPFTSESAPDWLSSDQPGKPGAGSEPGPAEPTPASEIPDWLSGITAPDEAQALPSTPAFTFEEQPSASEAGPEAEGPYLAALPDWVSNVSAEEAEAVEPDTNLKPADLPDWLEAMRPVGAGVASGPVEDVSGANLITAGPLAGLRGVLDAEPDAARASKPAAYSLKLHVTEKQQAQVELLKSLLESEQQAKPLPVKASFKPQQYLIRLLVALALILPIFWIVSTNGHEVPLPKPGSLPAVTDLQQLLGTVQNDTPVLVAFDYEPGFSSEMNLVASSVIRRLADQGAYLALTSTSPTGPALAEIALASLNEERAPFNNYANLGYIAGGAAGLRLLNEQPSQLLAYDLKGVKAWSGTPLEAVKTLADFHMILILTDDADTARSWIEQVGPGLQEQGTPLVMLVSTQIEPLVRPYYESSPRQVTALLGGLPGGAAFENATGYVGPARDTWDAFSLGLMISVVIILVGALFSVTAKTVASSRAAKK